MSNDDVADLTADGEAGDVPPGMRPVAFDGCFGWLHAPAAGDAGDIGVVLCAGLLADACTGHRPLRQLADALAKAGYPTLRFDYAGTGDSDDPTETDSWAVWQRGIHAAADWLRDHGDVRRIVLCGLRIGATLAAVAARDRADVAGLVLLAPFLRGRSFIRQLSIEANLLQSGGSARDGLALYDLDLSGPVVERISQVDLRRLVPPSGCRVAVFTDAPSPVLDACIAAWTAGGAAVACEDFRGLEPLLRPAFLCHEPSAKFDRLTAWLARSLPPGPAPGPSPGPPSARVARAPSRTVLRPDGCTEMPLRFGPAGGLFGMLCRPAVRPECDLAVLIVNSSGNPHQGFARFAVRLARGFTRHGIASLRMDFAGLGDSVGPDDADTHCFATDRTGDIAAAADALAAAGYGRLAILGLCSGAYHAYLGALADARFEAVVLINMPLFHWRDGDPVEFFNHATQSPAQFLPKLADRDVWRRLLTGRLDLRRRVSMQAVWCAETARAVGARLAGLLGIDPPASVAQAGMKTLSGRARTLFMLTEGDDAIAMLDREFGPEVAPPGATRMTVPGFDHSITGTAMQRSAAELVVAFLSQRPVTGAAPAPSATPARAPAEV